MHGRTFTSSVLILLFFFSFFEIAYYFNSHSPKPTYNISKQEASLNFDKKFLSFFSLGQKRLMIDYLWIETLIESDQEHYKGKDLNSWMFLRFDTITTLDPLFYHAYLFGTQYLSIIKDDVHGASLLYERGLEKYPNDFQLNFSGGHHYLSFANNKARALELLTKANQSPQAPFFLSSLVARLNAEEGELTDAYDIIKNIHDNTPKESSLWSYYHQSLYAIKAELDLDCLNQGKSNCETKDIDGKSYIKDSSNKYRAQAPWKPFRLQGKFKKR